MEFLRNLYALDDVGMESESVFFVINDFLFLL